MNWKKVSLAIKPWAPDATSDALLPYVVKTALISAVAAVLLHNLAGFVGVGLFGLQMPMPVTRDSGFFDWLMVVVVGPLLESVLVYPVCLFSIKNFPDRIFGAAILIGATAGLLHGLVSPFWFFGPAISFFVWSLAWFKWKAAHRPRSLLILLLPHMIQNFLSMLLMG